MWNQKKNMRQYHKKSYLGQKKIEEKEKKFRKKKKDVWAFIITKYLVIFLVKMKWKLRNPPKIRQLNLAWVLS